MSERTRTRLDEIVEEETEKGRAAAESVGLGHRAGKYTNVNAIARRAFEHGVEQAKPWWYFSQDGEAPPLRNFPERVGPAPAAPKLPTPPPGFKHTRTETTFDRRAGYWYWFGGGVAPWPHDGSTGYTSGASHAWELTGPPPVPKYEHTGEYREPSGGEPFLSLNGVLSFCLRGPWGDGPRWILREVEP